MKIIGISGKSTEAQLRAKTKWRKKNPQKQAEAQRRWKQCHPEAVKRHDRVQSLKKYGLTPAGWEELWHNQGDGLCAFCWRQMTRPKHSVPEGTDACVDHEKDTKNVRGLVHNRCNRCYIGPHTIETARQLLTYMERQCV